MGGRRKATEVERQWRRWRRLRWTILERDSWMCRRCSGRRRIEVHHVISLADGGPPFDPDNLICLCAPCHWAAHAAERDKLNPELAEWAAYMRSG